MFLSKSQVKDISQKIKPPQASIKNLKFERKKDFDSFLTYIKRETKTLDDIKLPKTAEVQRKPFPLLGALLGFGALGLLGMFGGFGSGSKKDTTDQEFSEKDSNIKLTSLSLASMKAFSNKKGRSGRNFRDRFPKKKDDDGGAAVDPNIGKGGKKQVDIEKTELEKTKRKARRIIRKRFVTKEKYESQQDRMKKASINLNQNRRRTVTLSQDMIDELRVEFQQQEAQTTVQGEAARRNVKEEINKQLTIEDAQKQAEEIRKQKQKNKQKIFARTRVAVETEMTTDQENRDLIRRLLFPDATDESERSVRKIWRKGNKKII